MRGRKFLSTSFQLSASLWRHSYWTLMMCFQVHGTKCVVDVDWEYHMLVEIVEFGSKESWDQPIDDFISTTIPHCDTTCRYKAPGDPWYTNRCWIESPEHKQIEDTSLWHIFLRISKVEMSKEGTNCLATPCISVRHLSINGQNKAEGCQNSTGWLELFLVHSQQLNRKVTGMVWRRWISAVNTRQEANNGE